MADKSLDRSYQEVLDPLVRGSVRHHSKWPDWFDKTEGDFGKRVGKVLAEYGYAPTPEQFYQAQVSLRQKAFGEDPINVPAEAAELAAQDEQAAEVAPAPKPGEQKTAERKRAH